MAPKRKSQPQKPPRRAVRKTIRRTSPSSSSSSSSLPTPTVPSSNPLTGRIVTTGRKVNFEFFEAEGFSIGAKLISLGLKRFCSLDLPTYPALVQEFYSTVGRGDGGLVGEVKGKKVRVNQNILSSLLEMPTEGLCPQSHSERGVALSRMLGREVHELEEVSANQLPLEIRLLHNICGRILFPKTGRFDFVSERDIVLMDCILHGFPLNLPGMMIGYMAEAGSKKKASLPYGMVLTLVFRSQDIPIPKNEPKKVLRHTDYYNESTLHRMGYKKVNNIWEKKLQEELSPTRAQRPARVPEDPPAVASSSSAPAPQSDDMYEKIRDLIMSEQESTRKFIKSEIENVKTEMESKISELEAQLSTSRSVIKDQLDGFSKQLKDMEGTSKDFSDSNSKFLVHTDKALESIEQMFDTFRRSQKDGMEAILEQLKRITR